MIKNFKDKNETLRDYNSELLLKILNQTSIEPKNTNDKELFVDENWKINSKHRNCLLYTSPSPRDLSTSRMPSSA